MKGRYPLRIIGFLIIGKLFSFPTLEAQERHPTAPELRGQGWVNTALSSETSTLEKLQGHVVVLVFFERNDEHSTSALKQARRLRNAYRYRGIKIVGVHSPPEGWKPGPVLDPIPEVDGILSAHPVLRQLHKEQKRRKDTVQRFAVGHGLPFPILLDHDRALRRRYRAIVSPTFYVIDHNGLVRATYVGTKSYQALSRKVDELLTARGRIKQARRREAIGPPSDLE